MLLLAVAGGVGAVTRFVVDALVAHRTSFRVPLGTLLINITGSLLLGLLTGLAVGTETASLSASVKSVLGTGFCGGYTTISTASVETLRLWRAEGVSTGVRYALATLVFSVVAAALGLVAGHMVAAGTVSLIAQLLTGTTRETCAVWPVTPPW